MTANLDALVTSEQITSTYRRYLQTLLTVREPEIGAALRAAIDETPMLDKGPYLEATPPYAPGASLRDLIDEGVVSPGFADLASDALPLDRPLYVHQETSIRKVAAGRNVVVATGTGSGKTESFLLPILDSLVREHERGELGPGVRALLLYPMNALANDQMKRLRQVLAIYPHITFGRYTGDTQQAPRKARELFADLNIDEPVLPNELLSREEMRATPPHLLLTNYAMLEYLLLRPQDMDLFGSDGQGPWRFLVVDEAHVYDGSQGAEVAMLLRRVRDRVAPGRPLQCIATSATVGADTDPSAVTKFATNLFGQPFEWDEAAKDQQDLVVAQRVAMPDGPFWGPLTASDYVAIAQEPPEDRADAVLAAARGAGWTPDTGSAVDAILHERTMAVLRTRLAAGPQTIDRIRGALFGDAADGAAGLAAMVDVASGLRRKDGTTALSARYHLFVRATEGAFTCLSPSGPHVQLARHVDCPHCDAMMFEIGSCTRCGSVHVIGSPEPEPESGKLRLRPRKAGERGSWFVLGEDSGTVDEDEEAAVDGGSSIETTGDELKLCTSCGTLNPSGTLACDRCMGNALRSVRKLKQRGEEIAGCLVCGARGAGTVRVFETGSDASGAVVTTTLYQNLPAATDATTAYQPGEGRKLLAFSDSRQAAAYFAPYLQESYGKLQRRRLLTQGLLKAHADKEPVSVDDLVFTTRSAAKAVRYFRGGMTAQEEGREIAPWVMAEAVATDDRLSLEGLGLLRVVLDRDPSAPAPKPLLALGLTADESWGLLQELVRSLRMQGAVAMPESVPSNHEIFEPRLGPIRVRLKGSESVRKILSWLPTRGTNRRVEYIRKVLAALGSDADPIALLEGIWQMLTNPRSPLPWLRGETQPAHGLLHQIDHERLRFTWVTDQEPVYQCGSCRRTAPVSVRGVCPALRCDGTLETFVPPAAGEDRNHYRTVYRRMNAVSLSAIEHTAQWANTEAAAIQHRFVKGDVNALSCSTTFELGVDVGELQAVMMRNMPPTTANYLQRAGRAGRRSGSAALVVTYAMRRSHDLSRFAEPEAMITGEVRAPYIPLVNERIDRRHAQSVAMSAFFRWHLETTGTTSRTAGDFFLPGDDGSAPPVTLVAGFLTPVPTEVREALGRIIPAEITHEVGVHDGSWVAHMVKLLDEVRAGLEHEVGVLDELADKAAAAKTYWLAERYTKVGTTLRKRELLGFLANRNVLPKYGFPVDSVELRTNFGYGKDVGANLDLTRDLSQAIHEYAPDATLVAGGQLWTSRGIYRMPGRELVEHTYRVCGQCGAFWQGVGEVEVSCPVCGHVDARAVARTLVVPEFGFIADSEPKKPGARPPQRSWSGAVHVLNQPQEPTSRSIRLRGGLVETVAGPRGKLISVADGPGAQGFWICDWCGHGAARVNHPKKPPTEHKDPMRNVECRGRYRLLDLAHSYETDLVSLKLVVGGLSAPKAHWTSVLYAIVEAACDSLEIARDDIGGSLVPESHDTWSISLFDRVPGGAGHVLHVEQHIERVLEAALRRVASCECGPETSCYGCLRSFSNQREHDDLSRGAAAEILQRLLGASAASTTPPAVPADWEQVYSIATKPEREILAKLSQAGYPRPDVGVESDAGMPIRVAWPSGRVALDMDLTEEERVELKDEGWTVLPMGDDLRESLGV